MRVPRGGTAWRQQGLHVAPALAEDRALAFTVLGVEPHQDKLVSRRARVRTIALYPDGTRMGAGDRAQLSTWSVDPRGTAARGESQHSTYSGDS